MKRRLGWGLIAAGLGAAGHVTGCAAPSTPKLTPEQMSALQTREIDAPVDATFRAAAGVMMDSGMAISMSDHAAGLVSGANWGYIGGVNHAYRTEWGGVLVWVRSAGPGRSSMRVSFGEGTNPEAEPVSRFAAQVQERVMMASEPGRASR